MKLLEEGPGTARGRDMRAVGTASCSKTSAALISVLLALLTTTEALDEYALVWSTVELAEQESLRQRLVGTDYTRRQWWHRDHVLRAPGAGSVAGVGQSKPARRAGANIVGSRAGTV